jgi:hypothetical protein
LTKFKVIDLEKFIKAFPKSSGRDLIMWTFTIWKIPAAMAASALVCAKTSERFFRV